MGINGALRNFIFTFRDFLLPYIPLLRLSQYDFAFLVHPRDVKDVYKKYPIAKHFSESFVLFFLWHFWPVTVAKINGPFSKTMNRKPRGIIISIPLTADQILADKDKALRQIFFASRLADKLGVKIIGLGAFTSSVSQGGKLLQGKVDVSLTNGNTLTVGNSILSVQKIIQEKNINEEKFIIAVVGATGSIGAAISQILLIHGFSNLILIGNTPEHLEELKEKFLTYGPVRKGQVSFSTSLKEIEKADMIIMAVAKEALIQNTDILKKNVILYDISQPKAINSSILKGRPDIVLFDGGLAKTPSINFPLDIGFPEEVNFSCLAETMLLSTQNIKGDFVGKVDITQVEEVMKLAREYNFTPYHIST